VSAVTAGTGKRAVEIQHPLVKFRKKYAKGTAWSGCMGLVGCYPLPHYSAKKWREL
jgi:hypothetical protein